MLHYLASQMRESRVRMRDEELQSPNVRRASSTRRNSSRSRSQSHSRSRGDRRSGRSQSVRSPRRRRDELFQFAPPMRLPPSSRLPGNAAEPFLITLDPHSARSPRITTSVDHVGESRPRRAVTLSPDAQINAQRSGLVEGDSRPETSGDSGSSDSGPDGNAVLQHSSCIFMSRRNQRTFARPWRFHEIYSDWSLTCIHRIFWLSVACIHLGIFLLFIGGFFHKTPSRLASSLVSLGIFILSSGLAMYTLAKSIIRARARQCERVLQVVLDLVEPPNDSLNDVQNSNVDEIVGTVDSPPPYEAPPPYSEPQGSSQASQGAREMPATGGIGAAGTNSQENEDEGPKTPEEGGVESSLGQLPPTYSSINIPDCVSESHQQRESPPAYSEFP